MGAFTGGGRVPERGTTKDRIYYSVLALTSLIVVGLISFGLSLGARAGMLDYALLGGCGAGGVFALYAAVMGHKFRWK